MVRSTGAQVRLPITFSAGTTSVVGRLEFVSCDACPVFNGYQLHNSEGWMRPTWAAQEHFIKLPAFAIIKVLCLHPS